MDATDTLKRRIHEKQIEANKLSIEVGLKAQDKDDPHTLAETENCLDYAIGVLEDAKTKLRV